MAKGAHEARPSSFPAQASGEVFRTVSRGHRKARSGDHASSVGGKKDHGGRNVVWIDPRHARETPAEHREPVTFVAHVVSVRLACLDLGLERADFIDPRALEPDPASHREPHGARQIKLRRHAVLTLVESLLELAISLFIDQVCYKDKFSGIGLFLKVPPGFREHQAYFESYVLVNALSQLGSHLRLNQNLLVETRVLSNLARYTQHMAEAVSEGWFIDGAQPLLDFTGKILEYLQQPDVASNKDVRLCSQHVNTIRIVFLRVCLWRLSELDEIANEREASSFLDQMNYWQTILFSSDNQESSFIRKICFLLYVKLVSTVKTVRLAATAGK